MGRFKVVLVLLAALTLTSCSDLQQTAEDLMRPPQLTRQQAELFDALKSALGVNSVKLKYPRAGEYRSAFVLHDLDGDGEEEALVFYDPETTSPSTKIMILDHSEQYGWVSVYETSGGGPEIDRVDFKHLLSRDRWDILIGWSQSDSDELALQAYSYEDGVLSAVGSKNTFFQMELLDLNGDGLTEVVLAGSGGSTKVPNVKLLGKNSDGFGQLSRSFLNDGITSYSRVRSGELRRGVKAIFVDAVLGSGATITEVLAYSGGRLNRLYEEDEVELAGRFTRPEPVPSEDIDGDRIVEIPWMQEFPGYSEGYSAEREKQYFTSYIKPADLLTQGPEEAPAVWAGLVSLESGYRFRFPESWVGKVTVEKAQESSEWRFYLLPDGEDENTSPRELLRIRVYGQDEVRDKFETYERVAKKGFHEYFVLIPEDANLPEEMAVTFQQCEGLLELMEQ